jgi:hypothetical protein
MESDDVPPGVFFAVDIEDPKERVQAYLDAYRQDHGDADVRLRLFQF